MSEHCNHSRIAAFVFDDGESASLWACHHCKLKFVPLDLEQEKDAARYRKVTTAKWWPDAIESAFSSLETDNAEKKTGIDAAIDDWNGK